MDILDKYVRHDVEKLLKDYGYHLKTVKQLHNRLDEITEISAQNYSGVGGSGGISDNTSRVAIEKINLESKLERYELDLLAIDRALADLTEEEQNVLTHLYIKPIGIVKTCDTLNLSQSSVYSIKDKAIKRLEIALY